MPLPILMALALGAAGPARDANLSPMLDTCLNSGDAAQGVDPAMVACIIAERDRQDARLNARYRLLMHRLPPADRTRLQAGERRWIVARDRHCDPIATETGGTIDRLNYASCLTSETADRRAFLDRYR